MFWFASMPETMESPWQWMTEKKELNSLKKQFVREWDELKWSICLWKTITKLADKANWEEKWEEMKVMWEVVSDAHPIWIQDQWPMQEENIPCCMTKQATTDWSENATKWNRFWKVIHSVACKRMSMCTQGRDEGSNCLVGQHHPKNCPFLLLERRWTSWKDAIEFGMPLTCTPNAFKDNGKGAPMPDRHKNIRVNPAFNVKHNRHHPAMPVANGQLSDVPVESDCSGIVPLRGFRLFVFLTELKWFRALGN